MMGILLAILFLPVLSFAFVRPRSLSPMFAFIIASVLWTKNSIGLEENAANSGLDMVFFFGLMLTNAALMAFYALYFLVLFAVAKALAKRKSRFQK